MPVTRPGETTLCSGRTPNPQPQLLPLPYKETAQNQINVTRRDSAGSNRTIMLPYPMHQRGPSWTLTSVCRKSDTHPLDTSLWWQLPTLSLPILLGHPLPLTGWAQGHVAHTLTPPPIHSEFSELLTWILHLCPNKFPHSKAHPVPPLPSHMQVKLTPNT